MSTPASRRAAAHQARSRLTWDDVRAIREQAKAGRKHDLIADAFGLERTNVHYIIVNHTWYDPNYSPGVDRRCDRPDCSAPFTTNQSNKRFCSRYCRTLHNNRVRNGFYARQAAKKAQRRGWGGARMIAAAWSIDGKAGEDGLPSGEVDPFEALADRERTLALAGLDAESVSAMTEAELAPLRAELARKGIVPSAQRGARA